MDRDDDDTDISHLEPVEMNLGHAIAKIEGVYNALADASLFPNRVNAECCMEWLQKAVEDMVGFPVFWNADARAFTQH